MLTKQEAQLMRTNPSDARGQSRSQNILSFNVRYSFLFCNSNFVYKTRLFPTFDFQKCRDLEILIGYHSRSLKVVPFDRLYVVSYYCYIVTLSSKRTVFEILDFKNAVTLKTRLVVCQGHWKYIHSIQRIQLPIQLL